MDRLTKRLPDGKAVMDCDSCKQKKDKQCTFYECRASLIKRLAAYEDTGLTPEEIKAPFTEDTMINLAAQALGVEPSRLRELAEADKDGRLVVLPCKVYETDGVRVYEHAVRGIIYRTAGGPDFDESTIGKSIFLTREKAERALQEMEGRKDG